MDMNAKASYSVKKWDEATIRELPPGRKLTKASVLYQLSGDLEGNAFVEYLMFYRHFDPKDQHEASAAYVGLIQFDGTLSGKSGTCVFEDTGDFEAGEAKSRLHIVNGSGTGQLEGITGTGIYVANKDSYRWELDYDFH
jgi:hypothetical protein